VSRIKDERELVSPMRPPQCVLVLPLLVACSSFDVGTPGGSRTAAGSGGAWQLRSVQEVVGATLSSRVAEPSSDRGTRFRLLRAPVPLYQVGPA